MPQLNDIATGSRVNRTDVNGNNIGNYRSGEYVAILFKYYRQLKCPGRNLVKPVLERTSATKFYNEHKAAFDRTFEFFRSHDLDVTQYVRFLVDDMNKTGSSIDKDMLSRESLVRYTEKLQADIKKKKIKEWFDKSVYNIVDMCIKNGYMSGKDCILALIRSKKIAQEFFTGRISRYFFAAMPNFKSIIPKLDHFARAEFADLYDKFDIYNTDINNVFLAYRNKRVNPLRIVDEELARRKKSDGKKPDNDDLFDPNL